MTRCVMCVYSVMGVYSGMCVYSVIGVMCVLRIYSGDKVCDRCGVCI